MSIQLSSWSALFLLGFISALSAQTTITVAAAADLAVAEPALSSAFEKTNPLVSVRFVTGASASLAQQIKAGAPLDVFLSANTDLIDQLHLDSPKTYAVGHVAVLWRDQKPHQLSDLTDPAVRFVALANPKLAPYGLAAQKALKEAKLWPDIEAKVVYGENVRQALQLFDSGNADAVLTAASLVWERHPQIVPSQVIQRGGVVRASKHPEIARGFLDWLLSAEGQAVLTRFGFDHPGN